MKILRTIVFWAVASLLGGAYPAHADDIDIYSDNAGTSGVPNVLLVLDNAANFSSSAANCTYVDGTAPSLDGSAGGIEQCAIYNVVSSLPEGAINLGLMVYNDNNIHDINDANCGSSNGGCLAQPLVLMSGTAKANFLAWVKTWRTSGGAGNGYIKASGEATAATMQEAWAYYAGNTGLSGRNYADIQPAAGCQKNFVIFIGNAFGAAGTPSDGGSSSPQAALASAPGVTAAQRAAITIPSASYGTSAFSCGAYTMPNHTDSSGLFADEWARYMYQTDIYGSLEDSQGITTYAVGLLGNACKPDYPALLSSMAKYGGGKYFATSSYQEISTAILKIINEVQAVNSVFSSASLPVSVNAQGTYLNQIFLGMFRPDQNANPRWLGNLKQYQFILEYPDPSHPDPNKATLRLGDSTGAPAISSAGTGFITSTAISYWTGKDTTAAPDSTGGFFVNDVHGAGGAYDSPDGEFVEKGGAAQLMRQRNLTVDYDASPAAPRKVYTYCPSGADCNADLTHSDNAFASNNAAITDAMLNATSGVSVASLTRVGSVATVTTSVNHGFATGDSVTISGATPSAYNGVKNLINKISNTQFSFSVAEDPPTPASGTYTASTPGAPVAVSSITRSGTVATVLLPGHGFVSGQSVTLAGAGQPEYNGTFAVTRLDADRFSFSVVEGPVTPAGGGTAKVGSNTKTIASVTNTPTPGVTRTGTTVTVTTTTNHLFATGNTVTITGVTDSRGNLVAPYNIGPVTLTKTGNKSFTYTIAGTTPASPATGTITADGSSVPTAITTLSRTGTVATATTAATHTLVNGQRVSISGNPVGTNEDGYVGTFTISNVTSNTFQYTVVTTPQTPATGSIVAQKGGTSDRSSLIDWVRGEDNFGDEPSPGSGYNVRESIHGDVLHSRPVVVNYGDDTRGLVVYYGSNDGVFRAVNGSQTAPLGSVPPGGELWGLVLPEFFGKLNRQRVNTPELKLPSTILPSAQPKDYFVDGSPGLFQRLNTDGTVNTAYLYLIMRRGGQFLYALDVSQPTQPTVMWRISAGDAGFGELGQTWSRPRVTLVKGYANPVVVFGAGYDTAEDAQPPTDDTKGRGIYVVDAVTGAQVWRGTYGASAACTGTETQASCAVPGMQWAIPADISFLDRDNDGKTDRFYAADAGGNVWRVDLESTDGNTPNFWRVNKLAALGCATGTCASGTTPRKFFYPPNVVSIGAMGGAGSYDAVMLGSGDREHPLISDAAGSSHTVVNRFYMLKDTATRSGTTPTVITETSLFDATTTPYDKTLSGFYMTFATGEKAVNASTTSRGTTFFGTNQPAPPSLNSCRSNLGVARGYALNPFTGTFSATVYDGGGLPPTPITGIVNITTADGETVQKAFCVGCAGGTGGDSKSPLGAGDLTVKVPKALRRTYWYKK